MTKQIEIGRLLSAGTSAFVVGCRVGRPEIPAFGTLVRAPIGQDAHVYGLIYDLRIQDDGLVRQLVTAEDISQEVLLDNRERRIVPVEMSVIVVGWQQSGQIRHQLPPRPPLSLDLIYPCDSSEIQRFTSSGRFGYFRHLLRQPQLPLGELLAAHITQVQVAHPDPSRWTANAVREIIVMLRDDYPLLTSVLGALDHALAVHALDKVDGT